MKVDFLRVDSFDGVYKRGLAVGESDMRNDAMHFQFREEKFTFPTIAVIGKMHYNGYFYVARIKDLRKLAKEKH